jgi:uncharacterized protein YggU (UPF0235/DUF167 family)
MRVTVRVIPRSRHNSIEREAGILKARLTAPPVDGAANEALLALLAEKLGIPRRSISIIQGATSRQKIIEIDGLMAEEVEKRLG